MSSGEHDRTFSTTVEQVLDDATEEPSPVCKVYDPQIEGFPREQVRQDPRRNVELLLVSHKRAKK